MNGRAILDDQYPNRRPFVFDVDGTLILADSEQWNRVKPLPGAIELLQWLRQRQHPFLVLTNGTARTPAGYAAQLRAAGLPVEADQVVTPSVVAAHILATQRPGTPVFVLGDEGTRDPLRQRGVPLVERDQADSAEIVLAGWAPALTYEDLAAAARAIWNGAEFWVAVMARALAAHGGRAPAMGGAIAAAVAHVTATEPRVIGKPAPEALEVTATLLGVTVPELVMVGDDLGLDIAMARFAGCGSVLVLTGTTRNAPADAADLVIPDLRTLLDTLEGRDSAVQLPRP